MRRAAGLRHRDHSLRINVERRRRTITKERRRIYGGRTLLADREVIYCSPLSLQTEPAVMGAQSPQPLMVRQLAVAGVHLSD